MSYSSAAAAAARYPSATPAQHAAAAVLRAAADAAVGALPALTLTRAKDWRAAYARPGAYDGGRKAHHLEALEDVERAYWAVVESHEDAVVRGLIRAWHADT
jgi:hypothetical protein